jgi:hypothetical protein
MPDGFQEEITCNIVAFIWLSVRIPRLDIPLAMISRLFPFLLGFFLLCGQQGAVIHELSHWHDDVPNAGQRAPAGRHGPQHLPEHVCPTCVAFAAMGAALPTTTMVLPVVQPPVGYVQKTQGLFQPSVTEAYESRAPPAYPV